MSHNVFDEIKKDYDHITAMINESGWMCLSAEQRMIYQIQDGMLQIYRMIVFIKEMVTPKEVVKND